MKILYYGCFPTVYSAISKELAFKGIETEDFNEINQFNNGINFFTQRRKNEKLIIHFFGITGLEKFLKFFITSTYKDLLDNTKIIININQILDIFLKLKEEKINLVFNHLDYEEIDDNKQILINMFEHYSNFFDFIIDSNIKEEKLSLEGLNIGKLFYTSIQLPCIKYTTKILQKKLDDSIKILYIPDQTDLETEKTISLFTEISKKYTRANFEFDSFIQFKSSDEIIKTINETDIIIDETSKKLLSPISAQALGMGKTVLKRKLTHPTEKDATLLQMYPILTFTDVTLAKKLESIIKEPVCLRDFGIRGVEFAEKNFSAKNYVKEIYNVYTSFIN